MAVRRDRGKAPYDVIFKVRVCVCVCVCVHVLLLLKVLRFTGVPVTYILANDF